jgi:death on curing protein
MNWRWVNKRVLLMLHDESLALHGGGTGIRDEGLLDSALMRPQNLATYGHPDVHALAACYCYGIAKNHPFVDGNKRAAFLSLGLFYFLNGFRLTASQADATLRVLGVADGSITEDSLAQWLRMNTSKRSQ